MKNSLIFEQILHAAQTYKLNNIVSLKHTLPEHVMRWPRKSKLSCPNRRFEILSTGPKFFKVEKVREKQRVSIFQSILTTTSVTTSLTGISRRFLLSDAKGTHKWNVQIVPLASSAVQF